MTTKNVVQNIDVEHLPESLDKPVIDKLLQQSDEIHVENLTKNNIKRAVAQLEKRISRNAQDRIKYADEPEKWVKSEVDLDEEVRKLSQLAAIPEAYTDFARLGGLKLLVDLLNHANTDIAVEVLNVLGEITDPETVREVEDPEKFLDTVVSCRLPEMSVDAILRINEDESADDAQAVSNSLQIFENLSDIRPNICSIYVNSEGFISWLLRRIRQGPRMDYNRVYASEVLGIILSNSVDSKDVFGGKAMDAVDKLLRAVAPYRKKDPALSEEEEFLQNLFDCLCHLMLSAPHRIIFGKAQGLELLIRMMKERKFACRLAVRLCDFALTDCPQNCDLFVEKLGLKQLFPLLMSKGITLKWGSPFEKEHEEHTVGILQSLCAHCTGITTARVLNKFTENNCEKLERLLELHEKYEDQLGLSPNSSRAWREIDGTLSMDNKQQVYLDQCENGLFILQQVDKIIVRVANMGNAAVALRVFELLRLKGVQPQNINKVIMNYCNKLEGSEGATEEKQNLLANIEAFLGSAREYGNETVCE